VLLQKNAVALAKVIIAQGSASTQQAHGTQHIEFLNQLFGSVWTTFFWLKITTQRLQQLSGER
jgi:hypothetical protein